MKFRYKVIFINIILLSIGISLFGYLFISRNTSALLKEKIDNAIQENNLIQANVEYQLMVLLDGKDPSVKDAFANFNDDLINGFLDNKLDLFIIYGNNLYYSSYENSSILPNTLLDEMEIGRKKYMIQKEDKAYYIYTASCINLYNKHLKIVTRNEITDSYEQIQTQLTFYRFELILIVLISCALLFFVSYLLTKPLESLIQISDSFGHGNFSARAEVNSTDEIGILANTYNQMAGSVEKHVEELKGMIQRQDQFIADFSHEVKTPMTSIIGYSDMLRSKEMSRENQITAASFIFSEGKRLEAMSQKLFDFIYTKQHSIEKKELKTSQMMNEVKQSVCFSLEQKGITLSFSCEDAIIEGDIQLLKSSFINLIDNARKASKEGTTIFFTGEKSEDSYIIKVRDQGIGIPKEHLSRITDEFYMVDKSRSRSEGGAGLGLSLAYLIFQCHNADFQIESTEGVGTTITVTFRKEGCENA